MPIPCRIINRCELTRHGGNFTLLKDSLTRFVLVDAPTEIDPDMDMQALPIYPINLDPKLEITPHLYSNVGGGEPIEVYEVDNLPVTSFLVMGGYFLNCNIVARGDEAND